MRAYFTELDLNKVQITGCKQHAGAARVAYNWGLGRKNETYKNGEKYHTAIDLHKELNVLKKLPKEEGGFSWMYEVSKCVVQEALRNLDNGFDQYFRRCRDPKCKKKGYPKFKKKKDGIGSFTLTGQIHVTEKKIKLPRLGWLRLKEHGYFPTDARIISATVSERAGRWFVSIKTDEPHTRPLGVETLGVDVGIKSLAVLSDGTVFENPKALKRSERRLRLLQKSLSRKKKGSENSKKAKDKLAKQHYKVACQRNDALHKVSDAIAKRSSTVVLETLNVAGMTKNHCLAKALFDASPSSLHRMITYKMWMAGGTVVKANRFFPSSKRCSACGEVKKDQSLKDRTFICEACGFEADRDHNAAINLVQLAELVKIAGSSPVCSVLLPPVPKAKRKRKRDKACGETSSGSYVPTGEGVKLVSVKQEPNTDSEGNPQGASIGSVSENGLEPTTSRDPMRNKKTVQQYPQRVHWGAPTRR